MEDGAESPSAAALGLTPFSILNHPFSLERTLRSPHLGGSLPGNDMEQV
jgi:hypothetical protein